MLIAEGIMPAGVQKLYGINTYEELQTVIKAGEYVVEIPSQTELGMQPKSL